MEVEIVNYCQTLFGCELPNTLLKKLLASYYASIRRVACIRCFPRDLQHVVNDYYQRFNVCITSIFLKLLTVFILILLLR